MQQRRGGGWPANKGGAGAAMMRLRGGRDIPIDMKIMDWWGFSDTSFLRGFPLK
jgi:hypothetical protein